MTRRLPAGADRQQQREHDRTCLRGVFHAGKKALSVTGPVPEVEAEIATACEFWQGEHG
jgi:hypothetical protein